MRGGKVLSKTALSFKRIAYRLDAKLHDDKLLGFWRDGSPFGAADYSIAEL
jgi:hypothetical protein